MSTNQSPPSIFTMFAPARTSLAAFSHACSGVA
ncbi:Uncharacterised protein [Vibrio cholerae]|nr:Uncharacterised protein [Vibrio cholerae]